MSASAKNTYRPEPTILNAINSIRGNAKFKQAIAFSLNVLKESLEQAGSRTRDNSYCFLTGSSIDNNGVILFFFFV